MRVRDVHTNPMLVPTLVYQLVPTLVQPNLEIAKMLMAMLCSARVVSDATGRCARGRNALGFIDSRAGDRRKPPGSKHKRADAETLTAMGGLGRRNAQSEGAPVASLRVPVVYIYGNATRSLSSVRRPYPR